MRSSAPERLEAARWRGEILGFRPLQRGLTGIFAIQGPCGALIRIVSSTSEEPESAGWEHVSVSTARRPPNWQEMCFVKDLFWDPEETVMQLHPPRSTWVNNHPYCLHMWRHASREIPLPPPEMVGVASEGELRGPAHAREVFDKFIMGKTP